MPANYTCSPLPFCPFGPKCTDNSPFHRRWRNHECGCRGQCGCRHYCKHPKGECLTVKSDYWHHPPPCRYGDACYRRHPEHFEKYSH